MTPAVSVVMPVHNAAPFLAEAIASIVGQVYCDFEFVILDDHSTDRSLEIAAEWARRDSRIRVIRGERQRGLAQSSNIVVQHARAGLVARMDADDVARPRRLEQQVRVLTSSPEVVLVGSLADGIDATGRRVRPRDRWRIVRRSRFAPFPHGSVMFRRATFDAIGGYNESLDGGEDYDLFHRMARVGRVVTLPDLLYRYRYHGGNSTAVCRETPGFAAMMPSWTRHYATGATRLWSGSSAGALSGLLADPEVRRDIRGLAVLMWAVWGNVSPSSLRFCIRSITTARDGVCGLWVKDGKPYEWRSER